VSIHETELESYESEEEYEEEGLYGETPEMGQEAYGETPETEQFLGQLVGGLFGGGGAGELESPLNEMTEMALANEVLEITNEAELDRFLGNVFRTVGKAVGGIVRSPVGRALGGALKNIAKKALPVVGGALGSFVAPGVGTALGSKLGSMASNLFEVELEGMNEQEAEFEVARRFVRLAAGAAQHAATAPRQAPPKAVARAALTAAARQHAPGLLRPTRGAAAPRTGARRAGRPMPPGQRPRPRPRPAGGPASYGPSYGPAYYGDPYAPSAPGDQWDGNGMADDGYDDATGGGAAQPQRRYRPQSGRWVRRGRKIVILGA
jgi:uncharacterized protein (DUF697 family)